MTKKNQTFWIWLLSVNIIFALALLYNHNKPDCAEAQPNCTAVTPFSNFTIQAFNSNSTIDLIDAVGNACWHYCAIHRMDGVDNSVDQGFEVLDTGPGGCVGSKSTYRLVVKKDVDNAGARCFNIF